MPITIAPPLATIVVNGHTYTNEQFQANPIGVFAALVADLIVALGEFPSDLLGYLNTQGITTLTGPPGPPGDGIADIGTESGDVFQLADPVSGTIAMRIGPDGTLQVQHLKVEGTFTNPGTSAAAAFDAPLIDVPGIGSCAVVICDSLGAVSWCQTVAGDTWTRVGGTLARTGDAGGSIGDDALLWDRDGATGARALDDPDVILGFLVVGQSWAEGGNAGTDTSFTTTALDPGYSLMPSTGVNPTSTAFAAFADLREGTGAAVSKETICSRAANAVQTALQAALGRKQSMFWAVAALGGTAYIGLQRGTPTYAKGLEIVTSARDVARTMGKRLIMSHLVVIEGEQNFGDGTIRRQFMIDLSLWLRDYDEDIRAITGQTQPVRALVYQSNRGHSSAGIDPRVPTAQLDWMDSDPGRVLCTGPWYAAEGDQAAGGTGAHLSTQRGYAHMGEIVGHALQRSYFGPGWTPVRIVESRWRSNTVLRVKYARPVRIDTSDAIVNDSNLLAHGFNVTDGAGGAVTISSAASVASVATATVTSATQVTLSATAGSPTGSSTLGGTTTELATFIVTVDGVEYGYAAKSSDTYGAVALALASAIGGGASASGMVITIPAATTLAAAVYSPLIDITLAAAPAGLPLLQYACVTTGSNMNGNQTGARGTVRDPLSWGQSATGPALYDWACVQSFTVPQ